MWGGALCVALAIALGARESGMLRIPLSTPLRYTDVDDTKFYLALVKGVLDHGWWTTNSSLGFPFGQQLYDFPQGADGLNLVLIHLLGVFGHNPALVANLFLLLTFGLVALSAYAVLVRLGVSVTGSVMAALIYALLPYHFWRSESHLFLSAYYAVPIGSYLFLDSLSGAPAVRLRWRPTSLLTGRSLGTFLLCLVVASAGLYYAAFAIVLLVGGGIVIALARRQLSRAAPALVRAALIAAILVVNLSPSLVYRAEHGSNPRIARTTQDTQALGLQLTGLVLPVRAHRLSFLSHLNQDYFDAGGPAGYCEACYETLGTVGDVGFIWLVGLALVSVLGIAGLSTAWSLERRAALGVALTLLIATVSGVSGLIALLASSVVRGWNRMSLFIAFFSLLAAALLADRGRCWLRRRGRPVWLGYLAVGAVAALGVADETTNYFLPLPGFARREWRSDAAFTTEIERRLPRGAAIFQLPQVPFPEGYNEPAYTSTGAGGAAFGNEYELMRGYLHSSTLRWSYGAMKGRPADWASALTTKPLGYALDAAAVDGFDGLWVDLAGYAYADRPLVESQLRRITGSAALSSPLGDLRFYDLRPLRGRLGAERSAAWVRALRSDSLHPLTTTCTPTGLELTNPSPHRRAARLSFTLSRGISGPTPVLMHLPGRPVEVLRSTLPNAYLVRRLTLAHGTERVSFSYEGHPLVPHQLEGGPALINPDLVDARHERLDGTGYIAGLAPPACVQTVLALKSTNPLAQ